MTSTRARRAELSREGVEAAQVFRAAYAFGTAIRQARVARQLRQVDLAELSGIAQADISRIERGQVAPTTPTLLRLTEALGVQVQLVLDAGGIDAQGLEPRSDGPVAVNLAG